MESHEFTSWLLGRTWRVDDDGVTVFGRHDVVTGFIAWENLMRAGGDTLLGSGEERIRFVGLAAMEPRQIVADEFKRRHPQRWRAQMQEDALRWRQMWLVSFPTVMLLIFALAHGVAMANSAFRGVPYAAFMKAVGPELSVATLRCGSLCLLWIGVFFLCQSLGIYPFAVRPLDSGTES